LPHVDTLKYSAAERAKKAKSPFATII